ncbi:serine hydrolase [Weissella confusa]|uniref:serine hydrolase n=1 Tax=Weissella confusa TaxID=1583 RepID=UPI0021C07984|nr:serine hydrolase [Weissella confusa]
MSGVFTRDTKFELVVRHNRPLTKNPEAGYLTLPLHNNIDVVAPLYVAGGGSAYSTAEDYAVFGEMLRNNGHLDDVIILSEATVADMVTPSLTEKQMAFKNKDEVGMTVPGYNYSNLMRILTNPEQAKVLGVNGSIGEFGWDGAGGNFIVIDPSRELVAVFMMQDNAGPEPILRRALYKALMSEFKVMH